MEEVKNNLLIPLSIIIAGALIGAGIYFSGGSGKGDSKDTEGQTVGAVGTKKPSNEELLKNGITLGDPNAPVLMVEYADFQCPFCGKFFKETYQKIVDNYIKTGRVLFVNQDFAFLGPESQDAAEAARCASDQGKYAEYHEYLYNYIWNNYYAKGENGENVGAFSKNNLKKFAADLKLNTEAFNACLENGVHTATVQESTSVGRALGVSGTPAFFINGELVTGALPFVEFQRVIESKLKKN